MKKYKTGEVVESYYDDDGYLVTRTYEQQGDDLPTMLVRIYDKDGGCTVKLGGPNGDLYLDKFGNM